MTPAQTADQIFVLLDHWIVAHMPGPLQGIVAAILPVVVILGLFPGLFAFTTVLERKGLGRIQNRIGPNRTGPLGILQPLADGVKSLTKEDIVPRAADKVVNFLAPVVLVIIVFLTYAVLPIGRNMVLVNLDSGVLYFFAVGAATEVAIFMAGWSSRNKYALLGAMRAVAQMISYEVPLLLSATCAVMIAGSLSTSTIVERQAHYIGIWPEWYVFTPWGFGAFVLFIIAALAESNRSPFDIPEGESEIIAGYFIEYSGFKFALFFLGEYLGMFAISGMGITLFLGGWAAPFSFLQWVPSYLWFFGKLFTLIAIFIWIRGTLPRLRIDQLMNFAWKFMLPMALVVLLDTGIWYWMTPGAVRWIVTSVIVVVPYMALGRAAGTRNFQKRSYRYAT
jgi:NADH-quinone oxidoreductase subunit H